MTSRTLCAGCEPTPRSIPSTRNELDSGLSRQPLVTRVCVHCGPRSISSIGNSFPRNHRRRTQMLRKKREHLFINLYAAGLVENAVALATFTDPLRLIANLLQRGAHPQRVLERRAFVVPAVN